MIELGGNIFLEGFSDLNGGEMVIQYDPRFKEKIRRRIIRNYC